MNQDQNTPDVNSASGAAAGFLIASLIFIVLVVVVKLAVNVPSIDVGRADLISQTLYEMHTNEVMSLSSPGWIDHDRGIVRLPIDRAMQIAAQEWQDPAEARADLISRAQRASAPAPKAAPKANPFE
jgi:hypothetical protein